jgi:hypothetical protein
MGASRPRPMEGLVDDEAPYTSAGTRPG